MSTPDELSVGDVVETPDGSEVEVIALDDESVVVWFEEEGEVTYPIHEVIRLGGTDYWEK